MQGPGYPQGFFVAGGTLPAGAPSYVERPADRELLRHIMAGELCYVLTTRQMGKSSLMASTNRELRRQGIHTALVDLTGLGRPSAEAWYFGFLDIVRRRLRLTFNLEAWWEENSALGAVRRFTKFFEEILPQEVEGQIVIFVDEIEYVLNLDFTDEFFAAVRALYNHDRALMRQRRLSFVFLGVAVPNDLIKERNRTPFNVGTRIDLNELSLEDAGVLLQGLPNQDQAILNRIFDWTNGHPYLTQMIGKSIADDYGRQWDDAAVDSVVASLFFTKDTSNQDRNLQFVGGRVVSSPNKMQLLRLYRDIYRGKSIKSVEQSPYQNDLKLYGLIRTGKDGRLEIRNPIYREVFNEAWIKENMAEEPSRRIAAAAVVVALLAVLGLLIFWLQRPEPDDILAQSYIAAFRQTTNPTLRLSNLADLIALEGYTGEARELFNGLSAEEQAALFGDATPDLSPQIRDVVSGIYTTLYVEAFGRPAEGTTRVLQAMLGALGQAQDAESWGLREEIRLWLEGRGRAGAGEFQSAEIVYDLVVDDHPENPATRLERALVNLRLGAYGPAIDDLAAAWQHGPPWDATVVRWAGDNPSLLSAIYAQEERPPFYELLPAPTPTATSTPEPTSTPPPANTPPPPANTPPPPTETPEIRPETPRPP